MTTCIAHEDEKQHFLQLDNEHTHSLSAVSEGSSSHVTGLNTCYGYNKHTAIAGVCTRLVHTWLVLRQGILQANVKGL